MQSVSRDTRHAHSPRTCWRTRVPYPRMTRVCTPIRAAGRCTSVHTAKAAIQPISFAPQCIRPKPPFSRLALCPSTHGQSRRQTTALPIKASAAKARRAVRRCVSAKPAKRFSCIANRICRALCQPTHPPRLLPPGCLVRQALH